MSLSIRERAPLRLSVNIEGVDGHRSRWSWDAHEPENTLESLVFSSTCSGGYEQLSCQLQRQPGRDYTDLTELSRVTARGAGGQIAWQGRLEQTPRQSGSQLAINPQAVGYQAALDDDNSAREIYVDADESTWQPASVQRKIDSLVALFDIEDATVTPDQTSGAPSVVTQLTGPWARQHVAEGWYDAKAIPIGALYYAWKIGATIAPSDTNWDWKAYLSTDDIATALDATAELRAAGPSTGSLSASGTDREWAFVQAHYPSAAGSSGETYPVYWQLAVVGNHGLPIHTGNGAFPSAPCVLASDVVAHAVGKWAPGLAFTTGAAGTIRPSTFAIPHLAFKDPGTASAIVKQAAGYELQDWFVYDGPTFYFAPRGTFSNYYRARVNPAQLQETGPQIDRIWNGVIVTWTDVSGLTRSAGPPGSGCTIEDASLVDPDPLNPANEAGVRRWSPPVQLSTSVAAAAIKAGQEFLQEQKLLDTAGQAVLVGHVEDSSGVLWPAWRVKAGDYVSFVDASSPSPRRVVRAEYDHDTRTCTVQLDQPPDGMQALLARIGAELAPLGF